MLNVPKSKGSQQVTASAQKPADTPQESTNPSVTNSDMTTDTRPQTVQASNPRRLDTFSYVTWDESLQEFFLHNEATRAKQTLRFYKVQLGQLVQWAKANDIPFDGFTKRHLDRYLVDRSRGGKAQSTLHHDAVAAKAFYRWCSRNDLIDRSPLADYQVRKAPRPPKHMPTDDEVRTLLRSIPDHWNVEKNKDIQFVSPTKRIFHRDRTYAIVLGLLDTACRIGEMLNLKVDDYQAGSRQILIRESKGREPRALPVSPEWAEALTVWVKLRRKVMSNVPKDQDEGWLFVSETGTRVMDARILRSVKSLFAWSGVESRITLHSLRRYSLNRLAKVNLLAAQTIAGHKETKTTLLYTQLDPDFVRDIHAAVGVARNVVQSKRTERRRRLL
jgi:site-specific recombinase XerD